MLKPADVAAAAGVGLGLPAPAATAVHFALVRGDEQVILPGLRISPLAPERGARELAIDAGHHAVYTGATSAAFEVLNRQLADPVSWRSGQPHH